MKKKKQTFKNSHGWVSKLNLLSGMKLSAVIPTYFFLVFGIRYQVTTAFELNKHVISTREKKT